MLRCDMTAKEVIKLGLSPEASKHELRIITSSWSTGGLGNHPYMSERLRWTEEVAEETARGTKIGDAGYPPVKNKDAR